MSRKLKLFILPVLVLMVILLGGFITEGDGSDKVALFDNIYISKDEVVEGDTVSIFGNITVDGTVRGDVVSIFGNVTVNGVANGDVVSVMGNADIGSQAVIGGNATAVGGKVNKYAGSTVKGEVVDTPFGIKFGGIKPKVHFGDILGLAVICGLCALMLAALPGRMNYMTSVFFSKTGRWFGIGLIAYLLFVPIIVALAITIVGIVVIIPFIIAFILAGLIGYTVVCTAVGRRLVGNIDGRNAPFIYLITGIALLFAMRMIPVIGWLSYVLLLIMGMGVVIDTRFGAAGGIKPENARIINGDYSVNMDEESNKDNIEKS